MTFVPLQFFTVVLPHSSRGCVRVVGYALRRLLEIASAAAEEDVNRRRRDDERDQQCDQRPQQVGASTAAGGRSLTTGGSGPDAEGRRRVVPATCLRPRLLASRHDAHRMAKAREPARSRPRRANSDRSR